MNAALGVPPHAPAYAESTRFVTDMADLVCVFEPDIQVVCLRRAPDLDIQRSLENLARDKQLTTGFRVEVSARNGEFARSLPHSPTSNAIQADVARLLELYEDLLGCPAMGVRLELNTRAMCPRFHVDQVGLRLLCTYRGPGTEWLSDLTADRAKLGGGAARLPDDVSGLVRDTAGIGQCAPFDLVLLKGCVWPGNERRGAIHRSPPVPALVAPRVLLAIDSLWTSG